MSYLLSWKGIEINPQDRKGMTPLHLAVKAVPTLKRTTSVRFLLIAGAERSAKDHEQKRPLDYCDYVDDDSLRSQLKEMLKIPSRCGCLMLTTPLQKMKKSPRTMVYYFCLWVLVQLLLFIFVYPTIDID